MQNRKTTIMLVLAFALFTICACNAIAEESYTFADSIPREAQEEGIDGLLNRVAIVGQEAPASNAYRKIIERYLSVSGIALTCPEGKDYDQWLQDTLKLNNRIVYLPDELLYEEEIYEWVSANAVSGDLLLYKVNGIADKEIIYVNGNKAIIQYDGKYKILPYPATYVKADGSRTKGSGIYAIAHLYGEKTEPVSRIQVRIVDELNKVTFTGKCFVLYEINAENGEYERSASMVLIERNPGVYELWNGNEYGISEDYVQKHHGLHIRIVNPETASQTSLPESYKINIEENELIETREATCYLTTEDNYVRPLSGKEIHSTIKATEEKP